MPTIATLQATLSVEEQESARLDRVEQVLERFVSRAETVSRPALDRLAQGSPAGEGGERLERLLAAARVRLARAELSADPLLSPVDRRRMLVPALLEQYRSLMSASRGEDELGRLRRLTEAAGVKRSVFEALGAGRGGFARVVGGGSVGLFDGPGLRSAAAALARIERNAAASAAALPGHRGEARVTVPVTVIGQPDFNDPQTRRRIHAEIDRRLDELARQGYSRARS
ncbi:MAG: hypothetical protein ACK47B_22515 [Armatimonadota bacterium]